MGGVSEHAFVIAIDLAEALDDRLSGQMLKSGGSINQAPVKKDPARAEASATTRSASDTSIARRVKATASAPGNALQPRCSSAATIRRLGSSMVGKPRRQSSPNNVDLPPPEQPEIVTKFSMAIANTFDVAGNTCLRG